MNNKIVSLFILILGLAVSASAAFYSVVGLSKLFAGAALQVMIMASCLEFAKIVVAGSIHTYWEKLTWKLKTYLVTATIILMIITSVGVYGFLSAAFQETYEKDKISSKKIELLDVKIENYKETNTQLIEEKTLLVNNISELSKGFSLQNSSIDKTTGEKISYTSGAVQKRIQEQLKSTETRLLSVENKISTNRDSIESLELQAIDIKLNSEASSELGPLKYVEELSGQPMNKIINWFILVIIVVFDPLAVAMIILGLSVYKIKKEEDTSPIPPAPIIPDPLPPVIEPAPIIAEPTVPTIIEDELEPAIIPAPIEVESYSEEKVTANDIKIEVTPDKQKPIEVEQLNKLIDDTFKVEEAPIKPAPRPALTPEKKKNMSHQQVREYEFDSKFSEKN